jgi:tRNA (mo5U34)-methyltransferase
MNGDELLSRSTEFGKVLDTKKAAHQSLEFGWYPYGILNNFIHLRQIFNDFPLESLATNKRIGDIGAADGDLAYFMGALGFDVDIIDYPPTNFNNMRGVKLLKEILNPETAINIIDCDIDGQFSLPQEKYDLIFLLGILYHLKNPYYILETLCKSTKHLILSTRVMQYAPDGSNFRGKPVAYLLNPDESNNDPTNFWIFTHKGLERLVDRCGWDVLSCLSVGDTTTSNPSDANRDERCFMLLKSRQFSG